MDDAEKYVLRQAIASAIDYPSVYMGGPSRGAVQKAIRIVKAMSSEYDIKPRSDDAAARVRAWRTSPWDSLEAK